jgi:Domain of unknown function (DUF1844)
MADPDNKPGSFTVTDRRGFAPSGDPRPEVSVANASAGDVQPEAKPELKPELKQELKKEEKPATPPPSEGPRALPPADFATLVLSLGSSAVMYLGEAPGPDGKKPARNLPMAKHAIDLLTVLEEKTKGNLTAEEEQILESLLFDLRLRFVESLKAPAAGG